jgi:hypothetical protein
MSIGYNILYELFKQNGNKTIYFMSFKKDIGYYNEGENKDDINKICRLGAYFVNLFMNEPTHIFDEEYNSDWELGFYGQLDIKIMINPEYRELILDEILLNPKSIPMLCKPNLWDENIYGGFIENTRLKEKVVSGYARTLGLCNRVIYLLL